MRTKTLLLTAALSAAGVASSMAQGTVFSVNAVGYVNTTVGPKFSIIANPLNASDNSINTLFKTGIQGTIPESFQVFRFSGTGFKNSQWDSLDGNFLPLQNSAEQVLPGEGLFVRNPSTSPVTITFVGEVPQGNLVNAYPKGFSLRASQVPQAGKITDLGYAANPNDQIYQFDNTKQGYIVNTFDDINLAWLPSVPTIAVGEGFFLKAATAGSWNRTFSVNQ